MRVNMLLTDYIDLGCRDSCVGFAFEYTYHGIRTAPVSLWERSVDQALTSPVKVIRPGNFFPSVSRPFPGGATLLSDQMFSTIQEIVPNAIIGMPVVFEKLYDLEFEEISFDKIAQWPHLQNVEDYLMSLPDVDHYHQAATPLFEIFAPVVTKFISVDFGKISITSPDYREAIKSQITSSVIQEHPVLLGPQLILRDDVYQRCRKYIDSRFVKVISWETSQ